MGLMNYTPRLARRASERCVAFVVLEGLRDSVCDSPYQPCYSTGDVALIAPRTASYKENSTAFLFQATGGRDPGIEFEGTAAIRT